MPYIPTQQRYEIAGSRTPNTSGELNYQFTQVLLLYLEHNGLCYQTINDIIGALAQAADEFRRRVVHNYEDAKIKENGDVYPTKFTKEEK